MDIKGRNFLKLLDFTPEEINGLVELAARLKADKKAGREKQMLKGKNIVLLFEKDSTRTRCAFEVGAYDQGAQVTYLGPTGSQMGKKESIADTARVLVCTTVSNTADTVRISWKTSLNTPASWFGTG